MEVAGEEIPMVVEVVVVVTVVVVVALMIALVLAPQNPLLVFLGCDQRMTH